MKALLTTACFLLAGLGGAATAQDDQTLADIRQEAAVLSVELQKLKRELSTTGAPGTGFTGGSTLERVDLMEAALTKMTGRMEALEFRIGRVVKDGTNQLDDMNFRLCELEAGCDIGSLPPLQPIGGESGAVDVVAISPGTGAGSEAPMDGGNELAIAEQADFDAARAMFDAGDFAGAAVAYAAFADTYTGGFLTGEAHFMRGEALRQQGLTSEAARAYLDSFSGAPEGDRAPDALFQLADALSTLGQVDKGCVMFAEVGTRFPGSAAATQAVSKAQSLGCPAQ